MVTGSVSPKNGAPVKVRFVGIMPTLFAHCQHCMEVMHGTGMAPYSEQLEEYPEEVRKQYFELSDMAQRLKKEFGGLVDFDVVDSASPQGLWMTIRHRILRTPCVLVQDKRTFSRMPRYEELREKIVTFLGPPGARVSQVSA